jgi:hypothetical protein
MIKETITPSEAVDFLNELLALDRPVIAALIANRVPCNKALADHPTVQAGAQHGGYHVGMLGILNGLFGTYEDGYGPITAEFGDNGLLVRFRITR